MIWALLLVPTVMGLQAFWTRSNEWRRILLVLAAVTHLGLTVRAWVLLPPAVAGGLLELDPTGLLFLTLTSVLFLAAAVYAGGYLSHERDDEQADFEEGLLFRNQPEAVFTGCLLLFLATMTLVCVSRHLGMLWVAIEATTLCSAPLIYYHRHHRSLEAAWKYLMICSVGIALALLGNFFLVVAFRHGHEPVSLSLSSLCAATDEPRLVWLKVAFVFLLVGYGTKMGLAPMHTWLPDAHSEAPSVVSALLSGALLNCAFLGILRMWQVMASTGQTAFAQPLLIGFGLVSTAVAAAFILGQTDFKRMLAYSSVEHMGLLALGVGLGGTAVFGAMLHAVNHSLIKAMLFLVAGNILAVYQTKTCGSVRGVLKVMPVSGALWIAGFLAIAGTPPFGMFLGKFIILRQAFVGGHAWVGVAVLAILAVVFIGMGVIVLRMAQGEEAPDKGLVPGRREALWSVAPAAVLGAAALALGLYVPAFLERLLNEVARQCGGGL